MEQIILDIQERIATLTKERDDFQLQASLQLAAMGGGIQELTSMLAHITEKQPDSIQSVTPGG